MGRGGNTTPESILYGELLKGKPVADTILYGETGARGSIPDRDLIGLVMVDLIDHEVVYGKEIVRKTRQALKGLDDPKPMPSTQRIFQRLALKLMIPEKKGFLAIHGKKDNFHWCKTCEAEVAIDQPYLWSGDGQFCLPCATGSAQLAQACSTRENAREWLVKKYTKA